MTHLAIRSERKGDELYIYSGEKLIYKKWFKPGTHEKRASKLFDLHFNYDIL